MNTRNKITAAGAAFAVTMAPISVETARTNVSSQPNRYQQLAAEIIGLANYTTPRDGLDQFTDEKPPVTAGIQIDTGNNTHVTVTEQSAVSGDASSVSAISIDRTGVNPFSLDFLLTSADGGSWNVYCQDVTNNNVAVSGDIVGNGTPNPVEGVHASDVRRAALSAASWMIDAAGSLQSDHAIKTDVVGTDENICAQLTASNS